MACAHRNVSCLNEYEFIRKYRCGECGAIMMCACDHAFGEKHLSHQLRQGCVLESQERVKVTHGFIEEICPECRGHRPVPAPKAPMHGRTSKIKRYYWREIFFGTVRRLEQEGHGQPLDLMGSAAWDAAEAAVVAELKTTHAKNPRYDYADNAPSEIVADNDVRVIEVPARHVHGDGHKVLVEHEGALLTVEDYAEKRYERDGFTVLFCESAPFHVLFGVYLWPLVQDEQDPLLRLAAFGEREAALRDEEPVIINTLLPSDFGTANYYARREADIGRYLQQLSDSTSLFDQWLEQSWELRQYLWAHDPINIDKARRLVALLGDHRLRAVLRYLLLDYWANYRGWPDLFVCRGQTQRFVEVKSSKDKLSQNQMNWIKGNAAHMGFDFEVLKLTKHIA